MMNLARQAAAPASAEGVCLPDFVREKAVAGDDLRSVAAGVMFAMALSVCLSVQYLPSSRIAILSSKLKASPLAMPLMIAARCRTWRLDDRVRLVVARPVAQQVIGRRGDRGPVQRERRVARRVALGIDRRADLAGGVPKHGTSNRPARSPSSRLGRVSVGAACSGAAVARSRPRPRRGRRGPRARASSGRSSRPLFGRLPLEEITRRHTRGTRRR